jgi:hypothetical protein
MPTRTERIELRSCVTRSGLDAELLVDCAGHRTDKSLLRSANQRICCGKSYRRNSGMWIASWRILIGIRLG